MLECNRCSSLNDFVFPVVLEEWAEACVGHQEGEFCGHTGQSKFVTEHWCIRCLASELKDLVIEL